METEGLGANPSQMVNYVHPVAYASRSTSATERHYSITELETLAVVCILELISLVTIWQ